MLMFQTKTEILEKINERFEVNSVEELQEKILQTEKDLVDLNYNISKKYEKIKALHVQLA